MRLISIVANGIRKDFTPVEFQAVLEKVGGPGSGNFGHGGRPGEVGGSGEGKGQAEGTKGSTMEQGFKARDKLTAELKNVKFEVLKVVPKLGQSSGVYIVKMPDGSKAIWKEQAGMKPVHLAEAMTRREPAAYEVDRLLGVNLTPDTVMREVDGKPGYLQGYAGAIDPRDLKSPGSTLAKVSDGEIAKAAMLDYVINSRDRYVGNFRVDAKPDGGYKLHLIDSSTSFGHEKDKLQAFTFLHEAVKRGIDVPPDTRQRLSEITQPIWNERLKSTLNDTERKESWDRLQNIVKGNSLSKTILDNPLPNFKFRKGTK
jgi:hypothetical protein